jgi:ATP-dependent Clp protease, protease subunit
MNPTSQAQEVQKITNIIYDLFAKHTGQTPATIQADTDIDFFMSAADALEYGLIDNIIDRPESAKQ